MRLAAGIYFLLSINAWAQNAPVVTTAAAVGDSNFKIVYGSASWNIDSTKPDSAFLFLRDKTNGKIVKIQLEESEPDSSLFAGSFVVNWGQSGAVNPEIFIPPKDMRNNSDAVKKFNELLSKGDIKSKPIVIKRADGTSAKVIDVYDTTEQAGRATVAAQAEEKSRQEAAKTLTKPALKEQDLEVLKKSKQQAMMNELALQAAKRDTERLRIEQIERQKAEERMRREKALSESARAERRKQAAVLAGQAQADYMNGNFAGAEDKFSQSMEMDPENKSYYFRYGVSLYRTNKFDESLVILKMTADDPETVLEKKYYMGLIHLRLKEYPAALSLMRAAGSNPKSPIAPSAAFYEGVILFTQEEYSAARAPFERVIDISSDPRLDEQAEQYLDQIIVLAKEKEVMSHHWFINGMVGAMYDSNVLLAADTETSQGSATKVGDVRALASGDVEYRPVYTKSKELGFKASGFYLWSTKKEATYADPLQMNISAPYTYKGTAFSKGYKFALKPAFETVYMDSNQDLSRENILQSYLVSADNTFVMHKNYIATYTVEIRNDNSLVLSSVNDNDADAMKYSLKTAQTFILDGAAKEILVANGGIVVNDTKGKDVYYRRIEVGANYLRPMKWDATLILGLSYYRLEFSKKTDTRTDNNTTFTAGMVKPVKNWVTWMTTGTYSNNVSDSAANHYSKWTAMTAAVFNLSL